MKPNQKIFITGASSGIGEAIAYEYASQGAVLGLAARRSEKLETVKTKCMELGAKDVKNYSLDVTLVFLVLSQICLLEILQVSLLRHRKALN